MPKFARLAAVALAALTLTAVSACDAKPATSANGTARQVTVVGNGKVQGSPDTVTTDVGISVTAPDATGALNQANTKAQAVVDALLGTGVDRDDITTTQVTLQPTYGPDGAAVTGYQASNSIAVKLRDVSAASRLLSLVTTVGGDGTRINGVTFSIDDESQLVRDAREHAFNDAKDRAQQYADLSGLSLGKVFSISEATGDATPTPTPMPASPAPRMMADVPLSPGQQTVSFAVTVVWELG